MTLPELKHFGYTVDDWQTWEGRWELINGIAYDMRPAPSPEHQRIRFQLQMAIHNVIGAVREKSGGRGCEVLSAPIDLFIPGEQSVYQPDLVVVCDPAKITARGIEGIPDLVVESLSPSTSGKDVTRKRWTYEAAGIPEYLIVDPGEQVGLLLRLQAGRYQEAARVEWGAMVALLGDRLLVTLG